MRIATIIFTYNRPEHTTKVLDALKRNEILPSKLFIFQDGLKESTNISDWEKVGQIIRNVEWCDTEVHIMSKNQGLANSVISGVSYVFEKYDAVIVLEDDCVPHPKFMTYMIASLNKYEDQKQVYSIGGDTWPINLQKKREDAYFCGRILSCGWGTWKDRWSQYERDYMILKRIKSNPESNERLSIWGSDLESQLIGNITGQCDSWAVFWALKVIEKGGYCLVPYESLIINIGYDGTGVHSGTNKIDINYRPIDNMDDYILPDEINFSEECKEAYKEFRSTTPRIEKLRCYQNILTSWVAMKQRGRSISSIYGDGANFIAVWGKGRICDLLIQEWEGRQNIAYIIESRQASEQYHGIPIISINELPITVKTIVVIPVYDMEKIKRKIQKSGKIVDVVGIDELIMMSE